MRSSWHIFFLNLYHPRRTKLAPEGFHVGSPKQFSGFTKYCENFPYDFSEKKASMRENGLSIAYIPLGNIIPQIEDKAFKRSIAHNAKIEIIKGVLTSFQT